MTCICEILCLFYDIEAKTWSHCWILLNVIIWNTQWESVTTLIIFTIYNDCLALVQSQLPLSEVARERHGVRTPERGHRELSQFYDC